MSTTYRTCKHSFDTGRTCASAAVTDQNYCAFHLHHRARLMRMAQYRARRQRFLLTLPPLENMYAVQSALNQLSEAAAAGMIDLKRARFLLSVVRAAGQFLLRVDKWQATPYHFGQPSAPGSPVFGANPGSAEIDLAAHYGLPRDLDLDLPLEVAFPESVILSEGRGDESKVPFVSAGAPPLSPDFGHRVGTQTGCQPPATDQSLPGLPFSGSYCGDHHSRECECCRIRPDHPVTPEAVEVVEVYERLGDKAATARSRQLERNRQRRLLRSERKRYEAVALERNLRRAAEILAERKLAERVPQPQLADVESAPACPAPPAVSAVVPSTPDQKRPVASADAHVTLTAAAAKSTA